MNIKELKKGDFLKITTNVSGHGFDIDEKVVFIGLSQYGSLKCESLDGIDWWYVAASEVKLWSEDNYIGEIIETPSCQKENCCNNDCKNKEKRTMKSPITGKDMVIIEERVSISYKGYQFRFNSERFKCLESGKTFQSKQMVDLDLDIVKKAYLQLLGVNYN